MAAALPQCGSTAVLADLTIAALQCICCCCYCCLCHTHSKRERKERMRGVEGGRKEKEVGQEEGWR